MSLSLVWQDMVLSPSPPDLEIGLFVQFLQHMELRLRMIGVTTAGDRGVFRRAEVRYTHVVSFEPIEKANS